MITVTLQTYLTAAQRLLHDSTNRFYLEPELIDYCNKARKKTAAETACTRQLIENFTLNAGIKSLHYDNVIFPTRRLFGILDIYFYYGTTRLPLSYFTYSEFARRPEVVYQQTGTPALWSQLGRKAFIAQTPQQSWTLDIDAVVEPLDLDIPDGGTAADATDLEVTSPYSDCVPFLMAYYAKIKDQRRDEAEAFFLDYQREKLSVISSTVLRRLRGQ